jgi:hypothetical protein
MSDILVNKIAESGLITLKPEEWAPSAQPLSIDLKDFLFKELILKEKDFREMMKTHDWNQYEGQVVCVFCSVDAIIPSWAFMLIATHTSGIASELFFGTPDEWMSKHLMSYIEKLDTTPYIDQRVIIKGCSDAVAIGPEIYMALTGKLLPFVKSLMFGEPCSTVPVYKRPKGA